MDQYISKNSLLSNFKAILYSKLFNSKLSNLFFCSSSFISQFSFVLSLKFDSDIGFTEFILLSAINILSLSCLSFG